MNLQELRKLAETREAPLWGSGATTVTLTVIVTNTFFFFLSLFVYFERVRDRAGGEGQREGARIPTKLRTVSTEPDVGPEPMKL